MSPRKKALASQTAQATQEIDRLVDHMRDVTARAVGAIGGIGETIAHTSRIAESIAGAIVEQGDSVRDFGRVAQLVSEGTARAATGVAHVSEAAAQARTAVASVRESSGEIARQGERLRCELVDITARMRLEAKRAVG